MEAIDHRASGGTPSSTNDCELCGAHFPTESAVRSHQNLVHYQTLESRRLAAIPTARRDPSRPERSLYARVDPATERTPEDPLSENDPRAVDAPVDPTEARSRRERWEDVGPSSTTEELAAPSTRRGVGGNAEASSEEERADPPSSPPHGDSGPNGRSPPRRRTSRSRPSRRSDPDSE